MSTTAVIITIFSMGALGLIWAALNFCMVHAIDPEEKHDGKRYMRMDLDNVHSLKSIGNIIEDGAASFLAAEYCIMCIFICFFSIIVWVIVDWLGQTGDRSFRMYATISYIIGSLTSLLCGYIGMKVAVMANYRTTYKAIEGLEEAFATAYGAGSVMGFTLVPLSMIIMLGLLLIYKAIFNPVLPVENDRSWAVLMELLSGYGLGGSSIALFGRVGGGIYTKAADVGADLVGKVEEGLDEDSPRNPATIADNVGDNVGDVAGMGSDLFGSFAESTCAALVYTASIQELINHEKSIYFTFAISASGILACVITSFLGLFVLKVDDISRIEYSLKLQLTISTVLELIFLPFICWWLLPDEWHFNANFLGTHLKLSNRWYAMLATGMGLVSGLLIGLATDYYTSNAHAPVVEMAHACSQGAAINIIYGLAVGYLSTIIPAILLSLTIIIAVKFVGMLGVAYAA